MFQPTHLLRLPSRLLASGPQSVCSGTLKCYALQIPVSGTWKERALMQFILHRSPPLSYKPAWRSPARIINKLCCGPMHTCNAGVLRKQFAVAHNHKSALPQLCQRLMSAIAPTAGQSLHRDRFHGIRRKSEIVIAVDAVALPFSHIGSTIVPPPISCLHRRSGPPADPRLRLAHQPMAHFSPAVSRGYIHQRKRVAHGSKKNGNRNCFSENVEMATNKY